MGQFVDIAPVSTGTRFRDDYGANAIRFAPACRTFNLLKHFSRYSRRFPVVQSSPADAMGRLNHDA